MCVKKNLFGIAKSVSLALILATGLGVTTVVVSPKVMAAEKDKKTQTKIKELGEASALMGQKKFKEALALLNEKVVPIAGKSAYEDSVTNQMRAYCLAMTGDNLGAAKVLETMIASNQVPANELPGKLKTIAQVYHQKGEYLKAIEIYERILKDEPNNSEMSQQLINAFYLKGDYLKAIENAKKLIKQSDQKPKKEILAIMRSSYHKLDNKEGIASTTEELITYFPTPELWNDMFKIVRNEVTFSDGEKIEYYRLKKAVGAMDATEYNEMAELALSILDSGDAKAALEAGISSGVIAASERTTRLLNRATTDATKDLAGLDAVTKEASSKPNGEPLAKIGAAYLGHGLNEKAITTLQSAIAKGGLKSVDEAYVRLGVANLNLGKKAEAEKAFLSVSSKSNLRRVAKLWVIYANKPK